MEDKPLLSDNVANMVTTVSLATRISLRCSSLFLDAIFEAAKYGTSLSLGISRNALTNAISTAKHMHQHDHLICENEIESTKIFNNSLFLKVLEKYTNIGLYVVNHTFSLAELFTISGLQFTSRTIQSSIKAAEESVRIIDGIFGSNDTSRAIASFISLVHRELILDPDFHLAKLGKVAMLTGLTKALTAFAVLQTVTHARLMQQIPLSVVWQGIVTDDKEDAEDLKVVQFKQKKTPPCSINRRKSLLDDTMMQELNSFLLQSQQPDNCNFDSKDSTFIMNALSNSRRKRQDHKRRFSSPDENTCLTLSNNNSNIAIVSKRQRSHSISIAMTTTTMTTTMNPPPLGSLIPVETASNSLTYPEWNNFPQNHIIFNIAHFMKYASAAYGESFMRILGIGDIPNVLPNSYHHHPNHHAFAHHTNNSVEDILLSSYTDQSPLHLHNPSIHALVHYVTVDHTVKAIVLTCRGTLGLSDILTDLSMHYTEFTLPNSIIVQAHGGMLEAAQLLAKEKGKVYQKIRQGLEMYPDYGLVLCGHSLGGSVASLLSVLWSESLGEGDQFVTSMQSGLPAGRRIHCYAYGPPGVMSLSLSNYCSGLVTSVVHGYDIVSSLSLGLVKDFKNVATSLHEESNAAEEIISRVLKRMRKTEQDEEEDDWFWAMIKTMRADMNSEKMYPPSTVYLIETVPMDNNKHKVILSKCENVKARFSEIVFTRTMFMDHSPLMYERAIKKLSTGLSCSFF